MRYLNVDLLLAGAGIGELVKAWAPAIVVLHRRGQEAVIELEGERSTPEQAILAFSHLVEALPPAGRARWRGLRGRTLDVGYERIRESEQKATALLEAPAVTAAARIGAAISFTIYDTNGRPGR